MGGEREEGMRGRKGCDIEDGRGKKDGSDGGKGKREISVNQEILWIL